ncbi:flagellar filament capping protein FliD [Gracilinema caldarium]|uniref:Flagellar hook-associated protein 2 n=1 Tax=Gracilinema caldarium (strain ATCC 51460 / DSM 7334 / H1) TaxID=744872 RepID=F8EZ40_GRAC1|nr:flagellar filament capping protein FliD [Gracilinema caldarium]AEJ19271.1 flagellar hook-associated 2 domain-containing protein [Gracilinema caldarium DSM 7334]
MSDIYIPGVKSRYDTDKLIEDLMKVERIPKERAQKNVENLKTEKTTWQDIGRRMTSLRESARNLYSFQSPFTERIVKSADESVITGTAGRDAAEQERSFIVKQIATADRFLSNPLPENYTVAPGNYTLGVGKDSLSFTYRGGSLKDFAEALNKRGRDILRADVITVEPGTKSLLIESLKTGSGNRLTFKEDAEKLALNSGMVERIDSVSRTLAKDPLTIPAGSTKQFVISPALPNRSGLMLSYEIATNVKPDTSNQDPGPPSGPEIPIPGSITYGGITIENDPVAITLPPYTPPPQPKRVDTLDVIQLAFTDGTTKLLPPISDSNEYKSYQYKVTDISDGKTIASISVINKNTHRDIALQNLRIYDSEANEGLRPLHAVSTAGDAMLSMDGIQVTRSSNTIDDLIPSVTLTLKGSSDKPVKLNVEPDRQASKDAIIGLVANYNRLLADLNVLTRNDDKIIQELSYLTKDEQEELKKKLGTLQGDSTLNTVKSTLQRLATSSYPTSLERDMAMLAQIGVSTDVRKAGSSQGYDASRLRGYLEIDEKVLDQALQSKLPAVKELFGKDTDGDLIVDSGFAYALDSLIRPYVQTGGIIALKTSGLDSRISQEEKRIENLDKQLAAKEQSLKQQYGKMEGALNSMEKTSSSLDQFSKSSNQ